MSPQAPTRPPTATPPKTAAGKTSTQDVKDKAAKAGQSLKDSAETGLGDAKSEAMRRGEDAKGQAADEISRTSSALRKAAGEFDDGSLQHRVFSQVADRADDLSETLSNRSVEQIIDSVSGFGRRNPAALIGGAVLAGLVVARFARASAEAGPSDAASGPAGSANFPTFAKGAPDA